MGADLPRDYLASNAELARASATWEGPFALDTEFMRTRTFYPIPGLYQVAGTSFSSLIDPLSIDEWEGFVAMLGSSQPVVMHSCSEDLELLYHHLGIQPAELFDTQIANSFVSPIYSTGYASLVEQRLGVALSKQATRSDWLKRPLSRQQLHYAHDDVAYLLELRELLCEELANTGRAAWCAEEMAKRCVFAQPDPDIYYQQVSGAWRLERRGLGALRSLCRWREIEARATDVPRNKVVWDEHLLELARRPSIDASDLAELLPRPVRQAHTEVLLEEHERGQSELEDLVEPAKPLSASANKIVKRLREVAKQRAESLGMAPELLARKREVEALVRSAQDAPGKLHNYADWRAELVGDEFLRLLGD